MSENSPALDQSANPPPRNEFLDYAKGILIFLVTLGHVIQDVIYHNLGFYQDPLFKAIYLFHMPLFMALAGYVAYGSLQRTPPGKFISRRLVNLVLPIFSRSLLAEAAILVLHPANRAGSSGAFVYLFFGSLWFLWALFESSLIVALAKKFGRDNFLFAFGSSALVCLVVPDYDNQYLFKYTFPFFWMGYLCAQNIGLVQKLARHTLFLTTMFAAGVVCYFLWDERTYVYVSQMTFSTSMAGVILFRFAAGVVGSITALWFFHLLFARLRLRLISWLGQQSLYVFVLQSYLFGGLGMTLAKSTSSGGGHFLWVLALTAGPVLALILSLAFALASQVIEKFPMLALLFFGKQLRK